MPDVWASLILLEEIENPIGDPVADFYVLEVLNQWIAYKWYSVERKEIIIIKPKG